MRAFVNGAAAMTIALCFSSTSCAPHSVKGLAAGPTDPMSGQHANEIHFHGHYDLEVRGQLVCVGRCALSDARVVAQRYVDSAYDVTKIVVDPDGRFHGKLAVSYGGTGSDVKLFPKALVFLLPGCREAVVPVSDPWPDVTVRLECP